MIQSLVYTMKLHWSRLGINNETTPFRQGLRQAAGLADIFVALRVNRFSNGNATPVSDGSDFGAGNRLPALSHCVHRRLPFSFRCRSRSDQCILDNMEHT
jgi:hypothetical protein